MVTYPYAILKLFIKRLANKELRSLTNHKYNKMIEVYSINILT